MVAEQTVHWKCFILANVNPFTSHLLEVIKPWIRMNRTSLTLVVNKGQPVLALIKRLRTCEAENINRGLGRPTCSLGQRMVETFPQEKENKKDNKSPVLSDP